MSYLPKHGCPTATFVMNLILLASAVLDAPLKCGMKMQSFSWQMRAVASLGSRCRSETRTQSFSKFNLASRTCVCGPLLMPIGRNFGSNPAAMLQRVRIPDQSASGGVLQVMEKTRQIRPSGSRVFLRQETKRRAAISFPEWADDIPSGHCTLQCAVFRSADFAQKV